jgi:hypothetical protein
MSRCRHIYITILTLISLSACTGDKQQEDQSKWTVTLVEDDKRAYGNYLAFESLKYYFPGASVEQLSHGFKYNYMDNKMKYNYVGSTLLILEGLNFNVSIDEWAELKRFISGGNEVVIFCSSLDDKIEQELNCYKKLQEEEYNIYYQSATMYDDRNSLFLASNPKKSYGYQGRSVRGFFSLPEKTSDSDNVSTSHSSSSDDSKSASSSEWSKPDTLGYIYAATSPNFLRYKLGEGHLTLHAAPLVLSNYFLLQDGNENYMTGIWQTLPDNIVSVYWNDYFKRSIDESSFDILWKYPATRYALLLSLLALAFYVLFEGKRKQRIIPIIEPLKNDSVSFVETVGRLYYNKRNHANLAEKMTQQFLEWVRTHYFLNTNILNDNFIHLLTIKSGQPESTVRGLMEMIHEVKLGGIKLDDAYLYQLYNTIQQFYKNNRT